MTKLSALMTFFPFFHAMSATLPLAYGISLLSNRPVEAGSWIVTGLFCLYLMPPLLYQVHNFFHPLIPGRSDLREHKYSPWWGGHQLQALFNAFPTLEAVLRVMPGAYSAWMRLWTASVGRGVYWTPRVQILDRPLIEIGDNVIWGHESVTCSHYINRNDEETKLYTAKIRIGSNTLIGARSQIGAGARIAAGMNLKYQTVVWVDAVIEPGTPVADITRFMQAP